MGTGSEPLRSASAPRKAYGSIPLQHEKLRSNDLAGEQGLSRDGIIVPDVCRVISRLSLKRRAHAGAVRVFEHVDQSGAATARVQYGRESRRADGDFSKFGPNTVTLCETNLIVFGLAQLRPFLL